MIFHQFDYDATGVYPFFKEAIKQQQGTMLIITENAENESSRFSNESFGISYSSEFPTDYKSG